MAPLNVCQVWLCLSTVSVLVLGTDLFCISQGGPGAPGAPESLDLGSACDRNTAGTAAELPEHNCQHLQDASKYPFPSENEFQFLCPWEYQNFPLCLCPTLNIFFRQPQDFGSWTPLDMAIKTITEFHYNGTKHQLS